MDILFSFITVLHVIISFVIIIVVLLQPGKSGGDLGSVFGGSSSSVFGAGGAVPFLTKMTRFLGFIFLATSLTLGYFLIHGDTKSVVSDGPAPFTLEYEADPADSDAAAPDIDASLYLGDVRAPKE